jgi:hypothetical protein
MTRCTDCQAKIPTLASRLRKVNSALHTLGLTYHETFPWPAIDAILVDNGFDALRQSEDYSRGPYRISASIGENKYLSVSWHRTDSGRWEVTAYVN